MDVEVVVLDPKLFPLVKPPRGRRPLAGLQPAAAAHHRLSHLGRAPPCAAAPGGAIPAHALCGGTAVFIVTAATANCSPYPSQAWLDLARACPSARPCANASTSGRAAQPVRLAMPLSIQPRRMYATEPRPPLCSRASLSFLSMPCRFRSQSRVRSFAASAKRRFVARHRSCVDRGSEPPRTRSRSPQITSSTAACSKTATAPRGHESPCRRRPSPAFCHP